MTRVPQQDVDYEVVSDSKATAPPALASPMSTTTKTFEPHRLLVAVNPSSIATKVVNVVAPLEQEHHVRGRWSWVYLFIVCAAFFSTFVCILWDNMVNSCVLQSATFDNFVRDSDIATSLGGEGLHYCGARYSLNGTYWLACSVGLETSSRCPFDTRLDDSARDNAVKSATSCFESTPTGFYVVYYMQCASVSVALNTSFSYALYAAILATYVYFAMRVYRKGGALFDWAQWKAALFNGERERDCLSRHTVRDTVNR